MRMWLTIASALALTACNAGDPADAPAAEGPAVANFASKSSPAVPPANAQQPAMTKVDEVEFKASEESTAAADPSVATRAWFAGRWTDTGDCAQAGEFAANGTYHLADGTRGMWNVVDGHLIVQHAAGRASVRLRKIDELHVEVINEDGSVGRSARC